MPNKKNPGDNFDIVEDVVTRTRDELENNLPRFTEAEFLEIFGTEFQDQLSDAGKNIFIGISDQNVINPALKIINKKFEEDFLKITKALPKSFFDNQLDLDITITRAKNELQTKLAKTKKQLQQNFLKELNDQGHRFTPEDETKIKAAYDKFIDKKDAELNNHLEKFKVTPATYLKYQLDQELQEAETKANKDVSHSITRDPKLEKLKSKPKPEPTIGFKVDKENLAEQIQSDIAAGKDININITLPDQPAIFKKMADIGFQYQKPSLTLVYMLIFFIVMYIHNNEKRAIQSIKDVIKEKQLFDLDLNKITLQVTTPTPNGNEKVIRKKAPLNPEQINELQSMIDENKRELLTHYHSTQASKKSGLSPTESGYNTEEEEEIPYSRPRP